jgi:hypothetical protein
MTSAMTFQSTSLLVRAWEDEVIDRVGFDARSWYVESFWLSIIGPSATWLLRRIAAGLEASPEGFEMPVGDTARALGLGDRSGRNSPFLRTVSRLLQFDIARSAGVDEIQVMRKLPPLTRRQIARLSPALQDGHARWQAEQLDLPPGEADRRRSRQLALSLLELGEEPEEVERQLMRWRYHPAIAHESATWAVDRHNQAMEVARAG